jgi:metal-sulfur cluster biosynthetic enzyme
MDDQTTATTINAAAGPTAATTTNIATAGAAATAGYAAAAQVEPATVTGDMAAPVFDAERRATELAILDALRAVVDPEIGMNVVELALIKQIILGTDETEVKMILTTPFCPYAGSMIQQVREQAESVVDHPVKVTLLAERWDPRDAGLMW